MSLEVVAGDEGLGAVLAAVVALVVVDLDVLVVVLQLVEDLHALAAGVDLLLGVLVLVLLEVGAAREPHRTELALQRLHARVHQLVGRQVRLLAERLLTRVTNKLLFT